MKIPRLSAAWIMPYFNNISHFQKWYQDLPEGDDGSPFKMKPAYREWFDGHMKRMKVSQSLHYPAATFCFLHYLCELGGPRDALGNTALKRAFSNKKAHLELHGTLVMVVGIVRRLKLF